MPPSPSSRSGGSSESDEARIGWRMAGLGFAVASEVAGGAILGYIADWIFGTAPRWTIVGALVGIAVGLWSLIRGALMLNRLLEGHERNRKLPPPISDEQWEQMDSEDRNGREEDD